MEYKETNSWKKDGKTGRRNISLGKNGLGSRVLLAIELEDTAQEKKPQNAFQSSLTIRKNTRSKSSARPKNEIKAL